MAVPKKKSKSHDLPKQAPKRTGKKGIQPRELSGDLVEQDAARSAGEEVVVVEEQELLKTPTNAKKSRRQPRLPAMEDPEIEDLEEAAKEYADYRDRRMALTKEETRLKDELLQMMREAGKRSYNHGGITIRIIVESEKVKVVVAKGDDE